MTLEKLILAALCLALLLFAVVTWQESRDDRVRLSSALSAQQQLIDAAQAREQTRDAALKITLAQIATSKEAAQTPEQIVRILEQYLHLPQPITLGSESGKPIDETGKRRLEPGQVGLSSPGGNSSNSSLGPTALETPDSRSRSIPRLPSKIRNFFSQRSPFETHPSVPQNEIADATSEPPGIAVVTTDTANLPIADLRPILGQLEDCRASEAQLVTAQADLSDEKARSAALTQQRDATLNSSKDGNLWHRLKHNAKWLAAGAAIVAVMSRIK